MIVVIQCAGTKRPDAGYLRTSDGKKVLFVADPGAAPVDSRFAYARPDDLAESGASWRDMLLEYNRSGSNPLDLLPAYELYSDERYRRLRERFGIENTYILSAGWGLINATFLTPAYDITFSVAAGAYARRRKADRYRDLNMLPERTSEPVVFFGGKDYVPLFCKLTGGVRSRRTVFYNSIYAPEIPGCDAVRYHTTTRTNWQYECVDAFLRGEVHAAVE
ncbi:hypothetical protein GCM10007874_50630 [Labrys miyagiensis]|uniref:Uncharacterized protein n=1 Tax=Labrys miyagiensis TaxID=346912 RepID=A0ABQ6CNW1_9HYPH|nr:hypothetical protein [Labrys miyagiensis]GLS22046.1 hypothetical protein GCM10007874_50630 [Labrys miyagiensis]